MSIVHDEDILLCFGCHCCNIGLYDKHYLGCASEFDCLCLETICCLKMGEDPLWCGCAQAEGKVCRIGLICISIGLVMPRACCYSNGHYCCLALSGILPPDSRFRSSCGILGMICSPAVACCPRLDKVKKRSEVALPSGNGNAPINQQPGANAV